MHRRSFATGLAALGIPARAQAAEKVLRIGMTAADIPSTTGQPSQGAEGIRFAGITAFDGLTNWDLSRADRKARIRPGLAESWATDPSDRNRWTFRLRQGVTFHDGSEFDAAAVVWNLDKVMKKDAPQYDSGSAAQSKQLAAYVPAADCDAQERLAAAGGVLMGKAATWEFAHGGPSWDVLFPPCRNPWDLEKDPAGSSSGSGASVAAGLVLGTMGSDTGGSIRGPAAANGIAGLKPTYGRVSRRGVLPNCFSHDHAGPLAWTVEDVAILLDCVAGFDPRDPGSVDQPVADYAAGLAGPVAGLTIGVPYRWIEEEAPASAATRAALDAALAVFRDLGATVRPVELPALRHYEDAKKVIAMAELYAIHGPNMRAHPERFGDSLRFRIIAGSLIRAEDYIQAMRLRTELARAMQATFREVDLMMLPSGEPAKRLAPQPPESLFTKVGYTTAFNVGGNPALSLCMGFDGEGMPFSLQIVGRLFAEATVLRAGHAYETATPWRARRPALTATL